MFCIRPARLASQANVGYRVFIIFFLIIGLSACASAPKKAVNLENVCDIFKANPRWYKAAKKSTERRGGNIQLPMAIIYQESTFQKDARPKRKKVLGFFPGERPSDAYGYAQALKGTWGEYETAVGSKRKRRDNFAHAFDFVQWYIEKSQARNGVSKWDYDAHYLNYHEGQGGYSRGTHLKKQWLLNVAARVENRAKRYSSQLLACRDELD